MGTLIRLLIFLSLGAMSSGSGAGFFARSSDTTSGIALCEKERFVGGLLSSCPFGYSFKDFQKKPDCFCISGM
jgi:hypothetical protein